MTRAGRLRWAFVGLMAAPGLPLRAETTGPAIFSDGFETGDRSNWNVLVDGTGAVATVSMAAALNATGFGLRLTFQDLMSGGTETYVQSNQPASETELLIRFRARWSSLSLPEGVPTYIVLFRAVDADADGATVFELRLQRAAGSTYSLQLAMNDSTASQAFCYTTGVDRMFELRWRAPVPPSSSAYLELWSVDINPSFLLRAALSAAVPPATEVEALRLGAMRCEVPGSCGVPSPFVDATGFIDLDEFESYSIFTPPAAESIFNHNFECQGTLGWSAIVT